MVLLPKGPSLDNMMDHRCDIQRSSSGVAPRNRGSSQRASGELRPVNRREVVEVARYGRPIEHSPEARRIVGEMRAGGATLQRIADRLVAEEIPTPRGGRWWTSTVHAIVVSLRLDAEAAQAAAH